MHRFKNILTLLANGQIHFFVGDDDSSWKIINSKGLLSDDTFSNRTQAMQAIVKGKKIKFQESALFTSDADLRLKMYLGGELSIYDLAPEEILSNLVKIQQHEEYIYQMKLKQCKDQQSMEELYQDYSFIAEYIKQTAYEAKQKIHKESEYNDKPLF